MSSSQLRPPPPPVTLEATLEGPEPHSSRAPARLSDQGQQRAGARSRSVQRLHTWWAQRVREHLRRKGCDGMTPTGRQESNTPTRSRRCTAPNAPQGSVFRHQVQWDSQRETQAQVHPGPPTGDEGPCSAPTVKLQSPLLRARWSLSGNRKEPSLLTLYTVPTPQTTRTHSSDLQLFLPNTHTEENGRGAGPSEGPRGLQPPWEQRPCPCERVQQSGVSTSPWA